MLSKKWHKLCEKNEESVKEEEKNEEKEDYNEVIIVNMNDDNSEIEKEDTNEDKNLKINSIKLKSKPKAILNVDPNSIKITAYQIENNIEQNNDDKIKDVINKYSYKIPSKYQDNNIINEIKNKYQINKMENSLFKENNYISRYIPGMYKNNLSARPNYLNKDKYYNYGPIYNYERKKDKINGIKEEEKEIKNSNTIEYKISNPYDNRRDNFILMNNNEFSNKRELRKDYPNLYYFNNILKSDISLDYKNYFNTNQDLSAQRLNRKEDNQYINNSNFINEIQNNIIKRNNSIDEIKKMNTYNIPDYKHKSYLFKKNNEYNREYNYIINDTDNIYQYYQPYTRFNSISKYN